MRLETWGNVLGVTFQVRLLEWSWSALTFWSVSWGSSWSALEESRLSSPGWTLMCQRLAGGF